MTEDKRGMYLRPGDWVVDQFGNPQEIIGSFVVVQLANGHDERHDLSEMMLMAEPPAKPELKPALVDEDMLSDVSKSESEAAQ